MLDGAPVRPNRQSPPPICIEHGDNAVFPLCQHQQGKSARPVRRRPSSEKNFAVR